MNFIPVVVISLLVLISAFSILYRRNSINFVLLTVLVAFVFRIYDSVPVQLYYFELTKENILWLFLYTIFVLLIQTRIKNYFVPVIFCIAALLVFVNSIIPFYLLFELMMAASVVMLIRMSGDSGFPKFYIPITLSLSVLTGVSFILFVATGSMAFAIILVFLVVIRSGLFPLWIMERKLFRISPYPYSMFLVSKTLAAVMLISKINTIIGTDVQRSFINTSIIFLAAFTILAGGFVINRTRDALNYFSSLLIVPVAMLYLSVCCNLQKLVVFVSFAVLIFAAFILSAFYTRFLNKCKIDKSLKFLEFVFQKKTNTFYYASIIAFLFLPLPVSPLLFVEYELIRNNSLNPIVAVGLVLCNVSAAFILAGLSISKKENNG